MVSGPGADARAAVIAALTQQIESLTVGDPAPRGRRAGGGARPGGSSGRSGAGPGASDASAVSDAPGGRRIRQAGHREGQPGDARDPSGDARDAPGDPEAVARQICLRLLADSARPRANLAAALHRRGVPDDAAERVLDRLTAIGLIDDAAYARAYVASKHRDRALGRSALYAELRTKGIAEPLVCEAVAAVDTGAETDRARALIARRVDSAMAAGEPAARRRLLALLARRGYPAAIAVPVVTEALHEYSQAGAAAEGFGYAGAGWSAAGAPDGWTGECANW